MRLFGLNTVETYVAWNLHEPQKTLYFPGPLLKSEKNEIIILELHGAEKLVVEFLDHPDLG
jgi:beta-galactosidase GanA